MFDRQKTFFPNQFQSADHQFDILFYFFRSFSLFRNIDYNPDTSGTGNRSLRHKIHPLNTIEAKNQRAPYYKCYEAELEIRETDSTDEREYTLTVQNEYGIGSRIVRLKVSLPIFRENCIQFRSSSISYGLT